MRNVVIAIITITIIIVFALFIMIRNNPTQKQTETNTIPTTIHRQPTKKMPTPTPPISMTPIPTAQPTLPAALYEQVDTHGK